MATFNNTRSTSDGFLFGGHVGTISSSVVNAFAHWNDARVTRNALAKLSDLQLDDIGLTRGDVANF